LLRIILRFIEGFRMNWRKPLIFAGLYLTGSKIPKNLKEIRRIEKMPRKEIEKYQKQKLKKILLHAYENVPYYHKVLAQAKVVVDCRVNLKNFGKIPILTRDILKKEFEKLKSKEMGKRKWYINHSGGSTGQPVEFIQDNVYWQWNVANKIYYAHINGKDTGEKEIKLWGSDRDILEGTIGVKTKIQNYLYNRVFLNSFDMNDKQMRLIVKKINKFKPKLLWGYVNSLEILADYVIKNNIKIYSPGVVFSAAGTLTKGIRSKIRKAFRCKVVNIYGTREVGDVAFEIEENKGLYITDYTHKLEVVDGKILITTLENYSMPLIRYDIGDVSSGIAKPPAKGIQLSILKDVLGRETSIFKTKAGKRITPEYFIHMVGVMYNTGFIKRFQVIQKDYDWVIIKIVLAGKKDTKKLKDIENVIKLVMGKNCKVDFNFVNKIKPTKSGKYLYTVSEVE